MNHLKKAITDAIEKGGYRANMYKHYGYEIHSSCVDTVDKETGAVVERSQNEVILLDPAFWQAIGRARGWGDKACMECGFNGRFDDYHGDCGKCLGKEYSGALYQQHRLIDHLAAEKDIESFFATL